MKERRFLAIALIVLILLLAGLFGLYLTLTKPLKPVTAKETQGFTFLFQIFGPSTKDRFKTPTDVAVDKEGNIYVTDTLNDRVAIFDEDGKYLKVFKTGVKRPLGIDVGPDGKVYVVSKRQDMVVVFDSKGKLVKHYKAFIPLDVAVEGKRVYITTIGPIVSFDIASGEDRRLIGWHGREAEDFAWPNGIAARDGKLYVADTNNLRLKVLKTNGKIEWIIGNPPTQAKFTQEEGRSFGVPSGVALDEKGNIFLIDGFRDRIYLYSKDKKQLASWGGERGDAEGQLDHPSGIAYGGDGVIYVVDKFNNRVQAFRVNMPGQSIASNVLRWWYLIIPGILLLALLLYAIRKVLQRDKTNEQNSEQET